MSKVQERMTTGLHRIMAQEDHQNVLAVSHNGACVSFLQTIWEGDENELVRTFPNCAIFDLSYENQRFKLEDIIDPAIKQSILKNTRNDRKMIVARVSSYSWFSFCLLNSFDNYIPTSQLLR